MFKNLKNNVTTTTTANTSSSSSIDNNNNNGDTNSVEENTLYDYSNIIDVKQQQQQQQQQLQSSINGSGGGGKLNNGSLNESIMSKLSDDAHTYQPNEKVTSLATSVYQQLEKIVNLFGRDCVKDLMPLVVSILEALDYAYHEKEELNVENELLKDDNEQLLNQYEREKQFRKDCEQKLFQTEDLILEQKKEYEEKLSSLGSIVRMIELKAKNASDHVARLEEKETEMKREYAKLHERYTELFKTHCDYMERTKILYGTSTEDNEQQTSGKRGDYNSRKHENKSQHLSNHQQHHETNSTSNMSSNSATMLNASSSRTEISAAITNLLQEIEQQNPPTSNTDVNSTSNKQEVKNEVSNETQSNTDSRLTPEKFINFEDCFNSNDVLQSAENFDEHIGDYDAATDEQEMHETEDEQYAKNDLSLFNELSRENYDPSEVDDGADLSGMTREVANLIRENTELLQTKHALNVLKDDLIAKLDSFSSEMLILREEIKSLQTVKACLQLRISELEEEAKKTRDELSQRIRKQEEDEENVPLSQRKRFTRAEMARVLMERNQYKERLMDLQEAVRWSEQMRASKMDSTLTVQNKNTITTAADNNKTHNEEKKKSTLWKIFSGLFGSKQQQQHQEKETVQQTQQQTVAYTSATTTTTASTTNQKQAVQTKPPTSHEQATVASGEQQTEASTSVPQKVTKAYDFLNDENSNKIQAKERKNSFKEKDRVQAYGWSLPSITSSNNSKNDKFECNSNNTTIPIPIYCQPLFENLNDFKLCCSTTVYIDHNRHADILKNTILKENQTSFVWISSLFKNDSHIFILDPNKPKEQQEQFILNSVKILSIQSIDGLAPSDSDVVFTEPSWYYPSVWMGAQEGWLFVHSSVENVSKTIEKVQLKDAVLSIMQHSNLVIVGLSDGSVLMFNQSKESFWDLKNYKTIEFGSPHYSVRTLVNVDNNIWCGSGNKIYEINPYKLEILATIEAHPRKESQVRHMVCHGVGVWISIRLDSTLRLFHAKTKQHLQYLDIEPFITRMLGTSNLGLSLIRITSMIIASNHLWIGTGNGAIISIPLSTSSPNGLESKQEKSETLPGGAMRIISNESVSTNGLYQELIPYCNLAKAQFSFHGHRDSVRFFAHVPGREINKLRASESNDTAKMSNIMLTLSGGQGYVDFRVGDTALAQNNDVDGEHDVSLLNKSSSSSSKLDKCYLIVWQTTVQSTSTSTQP